jgi:5-methylcytosine-specific restriction endonuclease McrA
VVYQPKRKRIRLKGPALQALFEAVIERDNYTCQNKGCPGGYPLDIPHHIKKRSQGGSDTMENLTTLCIHCHGKEHGSNYIRS